MAVRISGVTLPEKKHIVIALTELYGIGKAKSEEILQEVGIEGDTKTRDLTPQEEKKLRDYVEEKVKVEGDLRREIVQNIKHLKDVGAYRGARHMRGLPARGQRTRTNSRTVRGNVRRTAGSGKRAVEKK